jgi:hypothetical protein
VKDNRVYKLLGTRELTLHSKAVNLEALTRDLPKMAGLVSTPADAASEMSGEAKLLNSLYIH